MSWRTAFRRNSDAEAKLAALDRSQAVIEFGIDGTILDADQNFLDTLGYMREEIIGQKHAMFVEPEYRKSAEYAAFWASLRRGEFKSAQFKRIAKGGREVWIEASYNPILNKDGAATKIVKFATDITRQRAEDADRAGQITAIHKSQAVITFALDGTILDANQNFLTAMGYSLDEIRGRHHSMFVEPNVRTSPEYRSFWATLSRGEFQAAQYRRIGKGGREIWIQASYNPIMSPSGKPLKVMKFATDITAQMRTMADLSQMVSEIDQALASSDRQGSEATQKVNHACERVQSLSASAEQLAASVGRISETMLRARSSTDGVFDRTTAATTSTRRLSDAATAMYGIVSLIQNIAGQINLLALNATIEAARAGEAGRGFAVVAQEVKSLADQAAKATEQISSEIDGMQTISSEVVDALDGIRTSVELVREQVLATASSVQEQSSMTRELSTGMKSTADAVLGISQNIGAMSEEVSHVSAALGKAKQAATMLGH